ncbi:MAG: hypothetical protein HYY26_07690 [Acidobacteria bacterium]|nr:hypothetical protein [Acidobacteriota bacterium]
MVIATFISVFVLVSSALSLVFWLRSACRGILQQGFEQDYSRAIAEANQLAFPGVRRLLTEEPEAAESNGRLLEELERDYQALTYLLRNAATLHVGRYSRRERLLVLDFQLLRLWVRLKRLFGGRDIRDTLLEMAAILEYFSNTLGQRVATLAASVAAE